MKYLPIIFLFSLSAYGSLGIDIINGDIEEKYERGVDEVALSSQNIAIDKLSSLLTKDRGSGKESGAVLLIRLAELQQKKASLLFRISHGSAHDQRKTINLSTYHLALLESIKTLNTLILKYPHSSEISHALVMRGKSYEEMGKLSMASKDYLSLIRMFPDVPETTQAYLSLAEFAFQANEYEKSIKYLLQIEKRSEDPHYPFVLYKLAWSYYNLKNVQEALNYVGKHLAYYKSKELLISSQNSLGWAFVDNMLLDSVLFFFEGYENGGENYSVENAYRYFQDLVQNKSNGKSSGKIHIRFAKLLRSHGYGDDLLRWKNIILDKNIDAPESLDVVSITYEYFYNRRKLDLLKIIARDFSKIYALHSEYEGFDKVRKLILDSAENLQNLIIKNKSASDIIELSRNLVEIYQVYTETVKLDEPKALRKISLIHYNLAETLYAIHDYESAEQHYKWVIENNNKLENIPKDTKLKAIASRYEVLRKKQWITSEVKVSHFIINSKEKLDPYFMEWLQWIDASLGESKIDGFYFEANRTLYAHGHVLESIEKMKKFSFDNPSSSYAIASASLVIDTLVASGDWDSAHALSERFLKINEWDKTEFSNKLYLISVDTAFKKIEKLYEEKKYQEAIDKTEKYIYIYKDNLKIKQRIIDAFSLASKCALALGDKELSLNYYSKLITSDPESVFSKNAVLSRAVLYEESFDYEAAAKDYLLYLTRYKASSMVGELEKLSLIRKKSLILSWISSDEKLMSESFIKICENNVGESLELDCDRFHAILLLFGKNQIIDAKIQKKIYLQARNGFKENRALWALIGLKVVKDYSFNKRFVLVRQLGSYWENLDPVVQFALISDIHSLIPLIFQESRTSLKSISPLWADERTITRRVEIIQEIETAAAKTIKLPLVTVQAQVMAEVSGVYLDFIKEMKELTQSQKTADSDFALFRENVSQLVGPFQKKAQEIQKKASEIAHQVTAEKSNGQNLSSFSSKMNDRPLLITWKHALEERKWPLVAYLFQEVVSKNILQPEELGLMKAISMSCANGNQPSTSFLAKGRELF